MPSPITWEIIRYFHSIARTPSGGGFGISIHLGGRLVLEAGGGGGRGRRGGGGTRGGATIQGAGGFRIRNHPGGLPHVMQKPQTRRGLVWTQVSANLDTDGCAAVLFKHRPGREA